MKKFVFLAFFGLSCLCAPFAQAGFVSVKENKSVTPVKNIAVSAQIPELLQGIWQGSDRLVLFSNEENDFAVVLRLFCGWYDDRSAEPASFSELKSRDRNDANSRKTDNIEVSYKTVFENTEKSAGVYELVIKYPGQKETYSVPVCVINGSIYTDFMIRDSALLTDFGQSERLQEDDTLVGFWRSASNADGIKISSPIYEKEVRSFYVVDNGVYHIRYWKSGMDYTYEKATFSDGNQLFSVDKYLRIGNDVYQCTTGRSTKIRNIEKSPELPQNIVFDSENKICAFGQPYMLKVPAKDGAKAFTEIVAEHNVRRRDPPKPLFPPSQINFHWKEIDELRMYLPETWTKRNLDIHK